MLSLRPRRPTLSSGSTVNVKVDFSNLSDKNIGKVRVTAVTLSMSSSFFFLLSTFQKAITSTCFMLFTPNLDTMTMTTSHLCHMTFRGQKVIQGSQGSKVWFRYKKFQLQQKASNLNEILAHERSLGCAQKLNLKLNSKVIKGHFRVKFENIFKKSLKINARC